MSTFVAGFQSFFRFFALFCIGQIHMKLASSSISVKPLLCCQLLRQAHLGFLASSAKYIVVKEDCFHGNTYLSSVSDVA